MEIPPEVIAAKEALEDPLLEAGLITGIDFGMRDEQERDPEDLALRIFVADINNVPPEVQAAVQFFPFPVVFIQRVFRTTQLPDTNLHRPALGGVSVAASRFFPTGTIPTGTLGAIVTDILDPSIQYGLSNYHVLCVDAQRQVGDEIIQPEPTVLGILPGARIGTLSDFAFPETTIAGNVDAAICILEVNSVKEVADVGPISAAVLPSVGMLVRKRGRTTGLTFGFISGTGGSYPLDYPLLLPVTTSAGVLTTVRTFKNQIQIHIDFPQSIVFGEHGDSGSVVLDSFNQVVGLYWASGAFADGDPLKYGLANTAIGVERALGITF